MLELAFRNDVELLFSSDPSEVEALLERGDVAAVLLPAGPTGSKGPASPAPGCGR